MLHGTVVTMDDHHNVIENCSVFVRNDRVVATWKGKRPPHLLERMSNGYPMNRLDDLLPWNWTTSTETAT